jgi:hypothetical protein
MSVRNESLDIPVDGQHIAGTLLTRGAVLLVESEHDQVVPHAVTANYLAAFVQVRSLTHRTIPGADHGLAEEAWRQAYTSILVNWLTEMTADAHPRTPSPEGERPSDAPAHTGGR